jgi:hypothetical protein
MYFLLLFLVAFVIFSLVTTNWPVKIYHHYLLKQLGLVLHSEPQRNGLVFAGVYSQIVTIYRGRDIKIRFLEGASGALRSNPGLEIRLKAPSPVVLGIYSRRHNQQEWGDFKRFQTGDALIDSQWSILTDNLQSAAGFWENRKLAPLLTGDHYLEQMQVNHDETIVCLRRFHSPGKVIAFLDGLCESIPSPTGAI